MKFNMGCGHQKLDGWVNVDAAPQSEPDVVWNLEETPWPWPDGCAEEVRFIHSLEHMGGTPQVFLAIMKELYRICAPDAVVEIHVPHPRHDFFLNDPTHVRPITPHMLQLFDREANDLWKATGVSNSPLAHYTGVDFKITSVVQVLVPEYHQQLQSGALSQEAAERYARERSNIVLEVRIKMTARKAGASDLGA